jgi:hypothetical protein
MHKQNQARAAIYGLLIGDALRPRGDSQALARAIAGSGFGGAVAGCLLSHMAYSPKLLERSYTPTLEP